MVTESEVEPGRIYVENVRAFFPRFRLRSTARCARRLKSNRTFTNARHARRCLFTGQIGILHAKND